MFIEVDLALTHWTDNHVFVWDVRISFDYQPSERPDYVDGHMTYPGCDAGIVDMQVERREFTRTSNGTASDWVEFKGATDSEVAEWAVEIMEAINQEFIDNMGEQ